MHRLGFQGQIAGLSLRPIMLKQSETANLVYDILLAQTNKKKMGSEIPCIASEPCINLDLHPEPSDKDRYLHYKRIYARRARLA